ncbi:MAG: HIT family hydrolase, partial [Chloroflexota bacterium]
MERLWAPWRIEYIRAPKNPDGCVLCAAGSGGDDEERLVVHRGDWNFIIMNRYPYSPGHLLVAPYLHTADLNSLSGDAGTEHLQLIRLG